MSFRWDWRAKRVVSRSFISIWRDSLVGIMMVGIMMVGENEPCLMRSRRIGEMIWEDLKSALD